MGRFEEFGKRIDDEVARLKRMKNFEDFGKRVDEELARLKAFVKEDVAPETEKRSAGFVREVAGRPSEAASSIGERYAARHSQKPPNSSGSWMRTDLGKNQPSNLARGARRAGGVHPLRTRGPCAGFFVLSRQLCFCW